MAQIKADRKILILENIRSTHNVGALFRTADAAGITKIYLVGYTPDPMDRFGRPRKDVAKASLGAEESVPWEHKKSIGPLLSKLKKEGLCIIALEQHKRSVSYKGVRAKEFALVVGNEVEGVSESAIKKSDHVIEIPMKGKKESLNVSVAAGVALFNLI